MTQKENPYDGNYVRCGNGRRGINREIVGVIKCGMV